MLHAFSYVKKQRSLCWKVIVGFPYPRRGYCRKRMPKANPYVCKVHFCPYQILVLLNTSSFSQTLGLLTVNTRFRSLSVVSHMGQCPQRGKDRKEKQSLPSFANVWWAPVSSSCGSAFPSCWEERPPEAGVLMAPSSLRLAFQVFVDTRKAGSRRQGHHTK